MRTNSSIPCLQQLWRSDAHVCEGGEDEDLNNWSSEEKYPKKSTHFFLTSHQLKLCVFGGEEVVFAQTCTEMYVYTQLTMCKVQCVCVCVQTH